MDASGLPFRQTDTHESAGEKPEYSSKQNHPEVTPSEPDCGLDGADLETAADPAGASNEVRFVGAGCFDTALVKECPGEAAECEQPNKGLVSSEECEGETGEERP